MSEIQNKNDYSVEYFFRARPSVEMKYVHSVYKSHLWMTQKYGSYVYAVVKARRTGRVILQYNFNDHVPNKPV